MIWTKSRDSELRSLVSAGASYDRIAAIFRTDRSTIQRRAASLCPTPYTTPVKRCVEPPPSEMGYCTNCDVDIHLPKNLDGMCPGCRRAKS